MENKDIQPIILCGGFGTRLWPLSTPHIPKQFISLGCKGTFLDQTIERSKLLHEALEPILIMHEDHQCDYQNIIYEKYSNDTAVAIAKVCYELSEKNINKDTILLILPADHYVENNEAFIRDIKLGRENVKDDNIVLFGIQPTEPETKYGYIICEKNGLSFIEKPNFDVANELISNGALWNSGIILSKLSTLINCFNNSQYNIMDWIKNPRVGKAPSFDVSILQNYKNLYCQMCSNWIWSDVGTWNSFVQIPEIQEELSNQGTLSNNGTLSCDNVHILNRTKIPIAAIGCKDLLIINTESGLLVLSNKHDHSNRLKDFANNLYK